MIARSWLGLGRSLIVYRSRPWRTARLASFYLATVGPGDLAFDIGAHVGNRTRALRAAGARVVALEPQPLFHAFLRWDLPADVTLLPLAAGRTSGRADLLISRLHPTVSSLAADFPGRMAGAPGFGRVHWDAAETVDVTTLDALIAAHGVPRFIKIDVEGFEADVLAGLGQPIDCVALEYLPSALELAAACVERLRTLGRYEFNLVSGEADAYTLERWRDADGILAVLPGIARSGDVYARRLDG